MDGKNSVFISYRRDFGAFLALAIFQDLLNNGVDAFYDIESIRVGKFDVAILNQIASRPYFLPILTPGTLDRCIEEGDWVLREVEYAILHQRKVIPVYTPEFAFSDIDKFLPDWIATELKRYHAVEIPHRYFRLAMQEIRTKFLRPVQEPLTLREETNVEETTRWLKQAASSAVITDRELMAQGLFERGLSKHLKGILDEAITDYNDAIRLNASNFTYFKNRASARQQNGDLVEAISDYDEAIKLSPLDSSTFFSRGTAKEAGKDWKGALSDYNEAIRLNPEFLLAYQGKAIVLGKLDDVDGSITNFDYVIKLKPDYPYAYVGRGMAFHFSGRLDEALRDYEYAASLIPNYAHIYYLRAATRARLGDLNGAVDDYLRVIQLNPDHARAQTLLAFFASTRIFSDDSYEKLYFEHMDKT